ncbi:MAG: AsmA family protein [Acidobacteriota bacterium]
MTAIPPASTPPRRRSVRWFVIGVVVVLVLLAIAAIIIPRLADPERHRGTLEAVLSEATGWRARLGKLDVTIWGGVAVRVQPVTLISPSGESSVQIEAVEVRASLWPLLSGKLEVEKVLLVRPQLMLVRQPDGRWEFPRASKDQAKTDDQGNTNSPQLPTSGTPAADAAGSGSSPARARADSEADTSVPTTSGNTISIGEIEARGGTLRMVDRSAAPGGTLAIQELNALIAPATGRLWGQARFAAGPGKISWQGTILDGVQLDIESTTAQVLSDWFGKATIRPSGTFSARVRTTGWTRADLQAEGDGLVILAGDAALPHVTVRGAVLRDEIANDWSLDGTVDLGELVMIGGGRFAPSLDMTWRAQHEPIENAIGALAALGPLPVRVAPPGQFDAVVSFSRRIDGPLSVSARASVTAKSMSVDPSLPALDRVRATLQLDQRGLFVEPLEGALAGGPVRLVAQLTPAATDSMLTLSGTVRAASLESLLRATGASQTFPGKADLDLNLKWALARGRTLESLSGSAVVVATDVVLPAWKPLGDDATRLDRVDGSLLMDGLPWKLEGVRASGPTISVVGGHGTLHPRRGNFDLPLDVTLTPEASRLVTQRVSALKHLQGDDGQLQVSGKVSGPFSAPQVSLDLEKSLLKSGQKPQDLARGLLGDYLKRKQDKRDKKKKKPPAAGSGGP